MPESDPRTPDPLNRAHTVGEQTPGEQTGHVNTGTDSEQPARRADSRAAGSRGAHSKAGPSKPAKESKAHGPLYLWIKEVATVVAIAVVLSFLIKTFLFRAFYIPSESMVSTLDVNDRIFVNLLVPEPFALEHGDVVVFKDTKGWLVPTPDKADGPFTWVQDGLTFVGLLPDNSEQHLVKRVIGLPGDHVVCCDAGGKLTINGTEVDETYVNPAEVPDIRNFDVVVPDGKIWVMGDNRNHSADSSFHHCDPKDDSSCVPGDEYVPVDLVVGKVFVLLWPFSHFTWVHRPDSFAAVPAPPNGG